MVSYTASKWSDKKLTQVLILVVVDNGLVHEVRGMVAEKLSKS